MIGISAAFEFINPHNSFPFYYFLNKKEMGEILEEISEIMESIDN